jgi:prolyl-tRNA editing enzyme YbaK/EbsC (Cys-tRNA(Pro) deacylase)
MEGLASIGGGAHGVAINLGTADLVRHLGAVVADVTKRPA